ncbi:MAG TPA: cyclic pyranopterin monophosphate synthase MoaC [Bacteroidales bacterium]|nr:cyclic pyranopterin monophosphate synthase MoaC [Bacteroidales bacterium]
MKKLTHTDESGRASMVDIGVKEIQHRLARASGKIIMAKETIELVRKNLLKKGDVIGTARLAGINAAKQTATLIPLCHNIAIEKIAVKLDVTESGIVAESEISCTGKTGVEMEALTAVSVSLLTVYDMCKAVDKNMIISEIRLIEKIKK